MIPPIAAAPIYVAAPIVAAALPARLVTALELEGPVGVAPTLVVVVTLWGEPVAV
jgi:hypothetical protein